MASDRFPDPPTREKDVDRFESARAVIRTPFAALESADSLYADAFAQQIIHDRIEGRVRLAGKSIPPVNISSKATVAEGMAFRRFSESSSFAAANGFDPEAAASLAERVLGKSGESLTVSPAVELRPPPEGIRIDGASYIQDVVDSILSVVDGCRVVTARISTFSVRKGLVNSMDHDEATQSFHSELRVHVGSDISNAVATWVDWESIATPSITPASVARHFLLRWESSKDTAAAVPNRASVLLPPGWGGVWMHEAVGHLLEADTFLSGGSPLHGMIGKSVSVDSLDIVDDGTLNPSRVVAGFDDEGVETKVTPLIQGGVLVGLLTDRKTALSNGLTLTGNGRRPHFGLPPRPRMTNLTLSPGRLRREELYRLADPLIVVDTIRRAWLDAQGHRMHLEIEEGTLLTGGEPAGRVGTVVASAPPLQLLQHVIGVCDDFSVDLDRGYCMKDGTAVPVTVGQPSVLIADLDIRPAGA